MCTLLKVHILLESQVIIIVGKPVEGSGNVPFFEGMLVKWERGDGGIIAETFPGQLDVAWCV